MTRVIIHRISKFYRCANLAELSVRMPWEAPQPFSSSYLGQGQPYQTRGPRGLLPPPQSISLPPGEKGQPSLPSSLPPRALVSPPTPPTPPLRPSALHLSRGSLQSQDNLETSAGSLPETLKKFPPSLLFSLYPHLSCAPPHPHPTTPPALLLITGTLLYFFLRVPPFPSPPLHFRPFFCLLSLL